MVFECLCHVMALGFWVHEVEAFAYFHVAIANGPGVYVANLEVVDPWVAKIC